MKKSIAVMSLLFAVWAGASSAQVTDHDRRAAIAQISVDLKSMNAAWRSADFAAANRLFLDDGVMTFNGHRRSGAAAKLSVGKKLFAGQYVADYHPRYDILTRDFAVTTWINNFARIGMDGTRGPLQVAFMTIVWERTADGWHILAYHESTRPKALATSGRPLTAYAGAYRSADGHILRFAVVGTALNVSLDGNLPVALETFTDPNFGINGTRMTFIRNRNGKVLGVLAAYPDGSSRYAWRIPLSPNHG